VFERVSPRDGGAKDVDTASTPDCRVGVCGKSEKAGDLPGCGEVALRGLVLSSTISSSLPSLMVFSFSRVACRLSSRDDFVPLAFNTPLNMTLYRSSLISGISTSSNPGLFVEREEEVPEILGQLSCGTAASENGSVFDLITMGLCFGVFLTVLLLAGAASLLAPGTQVDETLRFTSLASGALGGSACFLPNSEPNSLRFCVFVLWIGGSGVCAGDGDELIWTDTCDCGCHPK
jgi:hypothetical protein